MIVDELDPANDLSEIMLAWEISDTPEHRLWMGRLVAEVMRVAIEAAPSMSVRSSQTGFEPTRKTFRQNNGKPFSRSRESS